jgi:hypothetical protein
MAYVKDPRSLFRDSIASISSYVMPGIAIYEGQQNSGGPLCGVSVHPESRSSKSTAGIKHDIILLSMTALTFLRQQYFVQILSYFVLQVNSENFGFDIAPEKLYDLRRLLSENTF